MDATKMRRLIELAREQAFVKHAHYVLMAKTEGHVQGMNDKEWGFSACPHPDCMLQRAAALDAAPREPEICICAAIVTENGQVIRGHRHADCMRTAADNRLKHRSGDEWQGFITSRNRYVDRTEAARLQLAAGIASADASAPYLHGECYSEDLYLADNDPVATALAADGWGGAHCDAVTPANQVSSGGRCVLPVGHAGDHALAAPEAE